ncbi:hypothetical protein PIB30_010883 [Stylosanthes scabra]|uniref:Uncharacterized protein n=1 Tax=Stylosanthes scabra TaxID=79078 RepID=A0ABU6S629_9FABA|nr:hypothetical protein [Stylosanthes scabra]
MIIRGVLLHFISKPFRCKAPVGDLRMIEAHTRDKLSLLNHITLLNPSLHFSQAHNPTDPNHRRRRTPVVAVRRGGGRSPRQPSPSHKLRRLVPAFADSNAAQPPLSLHGSRRLFAVVAVTATVFSFSLLSLTVQPPSLPPRCCRPFSSLVGASVLVGCFNELGCSCHCWRRCEFECHRRRTQQAVPKSSKRRVCW